MYFSVEIYRRDKGAFVAFTPDIGVYAYGATVEAAHRRLKHVVQFYLDTSEEFGVTLDQLGVKNPFEDLLSPLEEQATMKKENGDEEQDGIKDSRIVLN